MTPATTSSPPRTMRYSALRHGVRYQRQRRSWAKLIVRQQAPANRRRQRHRTGSSNHNGRRRQACSTSLSRRSGRDPAVGGVSVIDPRRRRSPNLPGEELQPRRPRTRTAPSGAARLLRHSFATRQRQDPVPHHRHHQHRPASTALSSPSFRSAAATRSGSTREPGTTSSRLATTWRRASLIRYSAPSMPERNKLDPSAPTSLTAHSVAADENAHNVFVPIGCAASSHCRPDPTNPVPDQRLHPGLPGAVRITPTTSARFRAPTKRFGAGPTPPPRVSRRPPWPRKRRSGPLVPDAASACRSRFTPPRTRPPAMASSCVPSPRSAPPRSASVCAAHTSRDPTGRGRTAC